MISVTPSEETLPSFSDPLPSTPSRSQQFRRDVPRISRSHMSTPHVDPPFQNFQWTHHSRGIISCDPHQNVLLSKELSFLKFKQCPWQKLLELKKLPVSQWEMDPFSFKVLIGSKIHLFILNVSWIYPYYCHSWRNKKHIKFFLPFWKKSKTLISFYLPLREEISRCKCVQISFTLRLVWQHKSSLVAEL